MPLRVTAKTCFADSTSTEAEMPADLDKEELVGGADAAVTFDVPDAPQPEHGRENESENGVRRPSNVRHLYSLPFT